MGKAIKVKALPREQPHLRDQPTVSQGLPGVNQMARKLAGSCGSCSSCLFRALKRLLCMTRLFQQMRGCSTPNPRNPLPHHMQQVSAAGSQPMGQTCFRSLMGKLSRHTDPRTDSYRGGLDSCTASGSERTTGHAWPRKRDQRRARDKPA